MILSQMDRAEVSDIDRHFAGLMSRFGKVGLLPVAAALLSRAVRKGHICLDLNDGSEVAALFPHGVRWPALSAWRAALCTNPGAVGEPDDCAKPMVLDQAGRLYLRRYWDYEQALAAALRKRCAAARREVRKADSKDGQDIAVQTALAERLCIITGGPGTGKTTTVLRILVELLTREPGLRIGLAAPTGKAAARMQDAIRAGIEKASALASETRQRLPKAASTIHRLLGPKPGSVYFRHDCNNPLPLDILVIDEVSMVALPLMAKLFDALPDAARVILLGDCDQLASVEPGNVLGDLAQAASAEKSPLSRNHISLTRNYRFRDDSGIFRICSKVREGDAEGAITCLKESQTAADLSYSDLPTPAALKSRLAEAVLHGFKSYLSAKNDPQAALDAFSRFRVLCALRQGPYGVQEINRSISEILQEAGLLSRSSGLSAGAPILITQNDHQLRIYNGDVGIVLPDPKISDGQLWAWFPGEGMEPRRLAPGRLPPSEPAWAMTAHKSQGSEFESVLFLLPDGDCPVLTRELVYTGLTRARSHVALWSKEPVLKAAIGRRTTRSSGLRDTLLKASREV